MSATALSQKTRDQTCSPNGLRPRADLIEAEPYYEPVGDELKLFDAAYRQQIPMLLKAPIGCGKTRFMEHMAWRLKRPLLPVKVTDIYRKITT